MLQSVGVCMLSNKLFEHHVFWKKMEKKNWNIGFGPFENPKVRQNDQIYVCDILALLFLGFGNIYFNHGWTMVEIKVWILENNRAQKHG